MTKLQLVITLFGDLDPEDLSQFFKEIRMKRPVKMPDGRTVKIPRAAPAVDEKLEEMAKKHGVSKEEIASRAFECAVSIPPGVNTREWVEGEEKKNQRGYRRSLENSS